ncbi:MAG TPA: flagellar hook-basal body complex protein FliE [Rhodospirillaceae bacterium]|nr:flagellar hook-basal body complex protein FliE [Rhodospirillaceae bacterium]
MVMNVSNALSAYKQAGDVSSLTEAAVGAGNKASAAGGDFSNMLTDFLGDAVDSVKKSEEMAAQGALGKADLQEVILAVSEAEVMMQTVTAIRDKMISAYQEVIRSAI